ncbi:hypothetical protein V6Z11_D07G233100 [Gossypium hirsutum]
MGRAARPDPTAHPKYERVRAISPISPISPLPQIPSPTALHFFLNLHLHLRQQSSTDPPLVLYGPRLHPFPPFPVSPLPQIPNPVSDPPPVLHGSTHFQNQRNKLLRQKNSRPRQVAIT